MSRASLNLVSQVDDMTFVAPSVGYGTNLFYYFYRDENNFSTFGTISPSGDIVDRFGVGYNYDAITFAAPDLGHGPNQFYYLRHDGSGSYTFGNTIDTWITNRPRRRWS